MQAQTRSLIARPSVKAVGLKRAAIQRGEVLCNYCGASPFCRLKNNSARQDQCDVFEPIISFQESVCVGFTGLFNTIRMGGAWADRCNSLNDAVAVLVKTPKNEEIGRFRIAYAGSGPLCEVLERHAENNHIAKHNGWTGVEAITKMGHLISKVYGPHIAKSDRKASAIYLRG